MTNEYLESKGWEFNGNGWIDPASKQPVREKVHSVKQLNGETKRITQPILPPIAWAFEEEEAVAIQRQREVVHA